MSSSKGPARHRKSESTGKSVRLGRATSKALDSVLGREFKVLNDGFVRVIDYLGNDEAIVQAARISYGTGTKSTRDDRNLIRYLMRHAHTSPFEMCEIKFHVRVPMDTWRQWIRHRTANVNEYSTRYSVAVDSAQTTDPANWRIQSSLNKQGSGGFVPSAVGDVLSQEERQLQRQARETYKKRLESGVAREQARKDLPLSTYTEAFWKIDLHNLLGFLELRMHPNAQAEIREYAAVIGNDIVSRWVPLAWDAFLKYRLDALRLSRVEGKVITLVAQGLEKEALVLMQREGLLTGKVGGKIGLSGEGRELEAKLRALGLRIPWQS